MTIEEIEREILSAIDIEIDMLSHEEETTPLRNIRRFVVLLFKESKEGE
jgi:hypothetical protein|tara:strand:+ start:833 stop:979 length:147 start_codon:yes stop_codon:yes gene_type:complete